MIFRIIVAGVCYKKGIDDKSLQEELYSKTKKEYKAFAQDSEIAGLQHDKYEMFIGIAACHVKEYQAKNKSTWTSSKSTQVLCDSEKCYHSIEIQTTVCSEKCYKSLGTQTLACNEKEYKSTEIQTLDCSKKRYKSTEIQVEPVCST